MQITYRPIGVIHSPFTEAEGMPIQPSGARGIRGTVEVFEEFRPGLKDLEAFSHVILVYHFHRSEGFDLLTVPFMDAEPRGVFATRAPKRPNPIGLSIVRLLGVEDGVLQVENLDVLDGTPLIDIKPYVPAFDAQEDVRTGWLEEHKKEVRKHRSDDRFA